MTPLTLEALALILKEGRDACATPDSYSMYVALNGMMEHTIFLASASSADVQRMFYELAEDYT